MSKGVQTAKLLQQIRTLHEKDDDRIMLTAHDLRLLVNEIDRLKRDKEAPRCVDAPCCRLSELAISALRDERTALRDTLFKVQTERDAEIARVVRLTERLGTEMLRADRAERTLAALREPSEAVANAAWDLRWLDYPPLDVTERVIRAAVAAAEQEVDRG